MVTLGNCDMRTVSERVTNSGLSPTTCIKLIRTATCEVLLGAFKVFQFPRNSFFYVQKLLQVL